MMEISGNFRLPQMYRIYHRTRENRNIQNKIKYISVELRRVQEVQEELKDKPKTLCMQITENGRPSRLLRDLRIVRTLAYNQVSFNSILNKIKAEV
jgi:hypothetical protein